MISSFETILPVSRPGMCIVSPFAIEELRRQLRCQSKECVMDTLGISSNTWTKMKRGEPIRSELARRAIARLGATGPA